MQLLSQTSLNLKNQSIWLLDLLILILYTLYLGEYVANGLIYIVSR